MSAQYYLAQMNIVRVAAPLDDPQMAEFVDQLDYVNALADEAEGFVWRFQSEHDVYDDDILLNMSVWESLQSLKSFVYQGSHLKIMQRGAEWTRKIEGGTTVLWWIHKTHLPDDYEAKERMDYLLAHGPSEFAFTFNEAFPMPEEETASAKPA